jgi:hypothetical protein
MKEYSFLITYIDDETNQIATRHDYDYSLERMIAHYRWTGLTILSIAQM